MLGTFLKGAAGIDRGPFGHLGTAIIDQTLDVTAYTNTIRWGAALSPDGTKFFSQDASAKVQCFEFSTPFDLATYIGGTPPAFSITLQGNARGIDVTPDGGTLFCADDTQNRVYEYDFGTAFDVTTLTYTTNYNIGNTSVRAPLFTNNGVNFYNSDTALDRIYYRLNISPYAPPSSGYSTQSFGSQTNDNWAGIIFQPDGLNCYVTDLVAGNYIIRRFVLSTAWNLSSYTDPGDSFTIPNETSGVSFAISSDGKYIFLSWLNTIYRLKLGRL
jgi:hypothetical protein